MIQCSRKYWQRTLRYLYEGMANCFSRVNSKTAFFVLKEAAAHVSDGGKIISIVTALLGAFTGYYTSYAGSKAPVEHFTRYVSSSIATKILG